MQSNNDVINLESFKNKAIIDYYIAPTHVPTHSFSEIADKLCLDNLKEKEQEILVNLVACAIICGDDTTVRYFQKPMKKFQVEISKRLKHLYTHQEPILGHYLVRFVCRQRILGHPRILDEEALALFGSQKQVEVVPWDIAELNSSYDKNELPKNTSIKKPPNTPLGNALKTATAETFTKMMEELNFTKESPEAKTLMQVALQNGLDFAVNYFLAKGVKLQISNELLLNIIRNCPNKEIIIDLYLSNIKQKDNNIIQLIIYYAIESNDSSIIKMVIEKHVPNIEAGRQLIMSLIRNKHLFNKVDFIINIARQLKQNKKLNLLPCENERECPLALILKMHRKTKKHAGLEDENDYSDPIILAQLKLLEFFMSECTNIAELLQKPFSQESCILMYAIKEQCHIKVINYLISLHDAYKLPLETNTLNMAIEKGSRDEVQDLVCHQLMKRNLPISLDTNHILKSFFYSLKYQFRNPNQFNNPTEMKMQLVQDVFHKKGADLFESKEATKLDDPENVIPFLGQHLQQDIINCLVLQYQYYCHDLANCAVLIIGIHALNSLVMTYVCDIPEFNHITESALTFFANNTSTPAVIRSPSRPLIYLNEDQGGNCHVNIASLC